MNANNLFDVLYARLLFTYRECFRGYREFYDGTSTNLPDLARILPSDKADQSIHSPFRDWALQYAYIALTDASRQLDGNDPKYLQALDQFPESPAIEEAKKHVLPYGLDHACVNRSLQLQLDSSNINGMQTTTLKVGGEGVVKLADYTHGNEKRAMKLPRPLEPSSDHPFDNVVRLINEGRTLHDFRKKGLNVAEVISVSGPNFNDEVLTPEEQVAMIRHFLTDKQIYVEMKYYDKGSLQEVIDQNPNGVAIDLGAEWGMGIARTLVQMHRDQVSHRDLKFANCLLDSSDQVLLADFGLSRNYASIAIGEGYGQGTLRFMAPEQLSQNGVITEAVDVWALGVMLFRIWTGKYPFDGPSMYDIKNKILHGRSPNPQSLQPELPDSLVILLRKCLNPNPDERFHAQKVFDVLRTLLESRGRKFSIAKYAWNPDMICRMTSKELVFLLVELEAFGQNVYEKLERILADFECTIFRIYRVFGTYDVIIRAFISYQQLGLLLSHVNQIDEHERNVRPITAITPLVVSKILSHWYWSDERFVKRPFPDVGELAIIENFLGIENWESDRDVKRAIDLGCIRAVDDSGSKKIFFVFIKETRPVPSRRGIAEILRNTFATFKQRSEASDADLGQNDTGTRSNLDLNNARSTDIDQTANKLMHESIYEIASGPTLAIFKAEVWDFFAIGELVSSFSHALEASGCTTETYVAADRTVVGQEQLNPRTLSLRATTKMLREELPEFWERWSRESTEKQIAFDGELRNVELALSNIIYKHGQRYVRTSRDTIAQILGSHLLRGDSKVRLLVEISHRLRLEIVFWAKRSYIELFGKPPDKTLPKVKVLADIVASVKARLVKSGTPDVLELVAFDFAEFDFISNVICKDDLDSKEVESGNFLSNLIALHAKFLRLREFYQMQFPSPGFDS